MRVRLLATVVAVVLVTPGVAVAGAGAAPYQVLSCSAEKMSYSYAGPVSFTASLDATTATLSGVAVVRDYFQWLRAPQLSISSGAASWQLTPRRAPWALRRRYMPIPVGVRGEQRGGFLCLAHFRDFADPLAIVGVYSGGAHCCTTYRLYDVDSRRQLQLDAGNVGATLTATQTHVLLKTADDGFSYAFTAFAGSAWPVTLLRPGADGFIDVTRHHPGRIRRDARLWWHYFHRARDGRGLLAAWAADEEMLGRDHHVWSTLDRLQSDPRLQAHPYDAEIGWPGGSDYILKLMRFLQVHGYRKR